MNHAKCHDGRSRRKRVEGRRTASNVLNSASHVLLTSFQRGATHNHMEPTAQPNPTPKNDTVTTSQLLTQLILLVCSLALCQRLIHINVPAWAKPGLYVLCMCKEGFSVTSVPGDFLFPGTAVSQRLGPQVFITQHRSVICARSNCQQYGGEDTTPILKGSPRRALLPFLLL